MSRRDHILSTLRAHRAELRERGIARLALFGSTARGEDTAESDVDLLADLDLARRISLIGLVGLQNYLSDLVGAEVDLIEDVSLRPFCRKNAERDRIHVF